MQYVEDVASASLSVGTTVRLAEIDERHTEEAAWGAERTIEYVLLQCHATPSSAPALYLVHFVGHVEELDEWMPREGIESMRGGREALAAYEALDLAAFSPNAAVFDGLVGARPEGVELQSLPCPRHAPGRHWSSEAGDMRFSRCACGTDAVLRARLEEHQDYLDAQAAEVMQAATRAAGATGGAADARAPESCAARAGAFAALPAARAVVPPSAEGPATVRRCTPSRAPVQGALAPSGALCPAAVETSSAVAAETSRAVAASCGRRIPVPGGAGTSADGAHNAPRRRSVVAAAPSTPTRRIAAHSTNAGATALQTPVRWVEEPQVAGVPSLVLIPVAAPSVLVARRISDSNERAVIMGKPPL